MQHTQGMTPIKIPGKNVRDQRRAIVAANQGKTRPRPLGRPPKRHRANSSVTSTGATVESQTSMRLRSLKNLKSKRKMASLEKLPTELLLKVFLFSMNLDLPRSSPIIAGKLSSEYTYIQTIMSVFRPTWEWKYHRRSNHNLPVYSKNRATSTDGDPRLQSALLRCRWAALPILMKAQKNWLRDAVSDQDLNDPEISLLLDDGPTVEWTENDVLFLKHYDEFIAHASNVDYVKYDVDFKFPQKWTGLLGVHPEAEIPNRLLRGPWTSDDMLHFFWLVRAGAIVDWIESTSGEVALLGLNTAIETGNLQVLWILYWLDISRHISFETLNWAAENAGGAGGDRRTLLTLLKNMYAVCNPRDYRLRTLKTM